MWIRGSEMCRKCRRIGHLCDKCLDEMSRIKLSIVQELDEFNRILKSLREKEKILAKEQRRFKKFWRDHEGLRIPPRLTLKELVDSLLSGKDLISPDFKLITNRNDRVLISVRDEEFAMVRIVKSYESRYILYLGVHLCDLDGLKSCIVSVPRECLHYVGTYFILDYRDIFVVEREDVNTFEIIDQWDFNAKYLAWLRVTGCAHNRYAMSKFLRIAYGCSYT